MNLKDADKEVLIQHRIRQSNETLEEVQFLLDNKKLSLAVNRIYYAIFYVISAAAIKNGFSTSKHKQLLGWFNKNFLKNEKIDPTYSKLIYAAYQNREKSDYDFLFELSIEEVTSLFNRTKEFVKTIKENI